MHTFFIETDERFAIMDMELTESDNHLQIYIQLDFTEYEYTILIKRKMGDL